MIPNRHPLFTKIPVDSPVDSREGFYSGFLGIQTRKYFLTGCLMNIPELVSISGSGLPEYNEEYFEWLDLLDSLSSSGDTFRMIELGAGYGRWLIRAFFLNRFIKNGKCKLIGVEAEPDHFKWMKEHFQDNGVDIREHTLIEAIILDREGMAKFNVGHPGDCYGQRISTSTDLALILKDKLSGEKARKIRTVKTITLNSLLSPLESIDLIDIDIQGVEFRVLKNAELSTVKRIHIGTHGREIEANLRKLFTSLGWKPRFDFPCNSIQLTEYGRMKFEDGVQTWINPKFGPRNS